MRIGPEVRPDVTLRWMGLDRGALCKELRLSFVVHGHTVNIYRYTPGRKGKNTNHPDIRREIDVMTIGDMATGEVTYDDFKQAVTSYIEECVKEDRHLLAEAVAWPKYAEPEAFERVYGRKREVLSGTSSNVR